MRNLFSWLVSFSLLSFLAAIPVLAADVVDYRFTQYDALPEDGLEPLWRRVHEWLGEGGDPIHLWKRRLDRTGAEPSAFAAPDLDDSSWDSVTIVDRWGSTPAWAYYRTTYRIPQTILAVSVSAQPLHLVVHAREHATIWVNGSRATEVDGEDGHVLLTPNALPGSELTLTVRVAAGEGVGELLGVNVVPEADWVAERDLRRSLAAIRRARLFMQRHPAPRRPLPPPLLTEESGEPRRRSLSPRRPLGETESTLGRFPEAWLDPIRDALQAIRAGVENRGTLRDTVREANEKLAAFETAIQDEPLLFVPPYLQDPGPDRMTLCWETATPAPSTVWYGPSRLEERRVHDPTPVTRHTVTLTGLEAGTEYRYRVASGVFATRTATFRTFETRPKAIRLILWANGRSDAAFTERVGEAMARETGVDCLIGLGDICARGDRPWNWIDSYFLPLRRLLARVPSRLTVGNRDYADAWVARRIPEFEDRVVQSAQTAGANAYWYSFDIGDVHLIGLDPYKDASPVAPGIVPGTPQWQWLERDLENARKARWKLLFSHAPIMDGPGHEELRSLLEAGGVDLFFSAQGSEYKHNLPSLGDRRAVTVDDSIVHVQLGGGPLSTSGVAGAAVDGDSRVITPTRADFCLVELQKGRLTLEARRLLKGDLGATVIDRFTLHQKWGRLRVVADGNYGG